MPPNIFKIRSALHGRQARAFSLIELLVVMGILSIVLTLAVSGFQRLAQGSPLDKALAGISGGFEIARQAAISKSTYTWVCLAEDDLGAEGNVVTMAIFASKDGDLSNKSADNYRLIHRVEEFPGVVLGEGSDIADSIEERMPVRSGATARTLERPQSMLPFDKLPNWARDRNFSGGRVVMFSPQGEAALDKNEESPADVPIYEALQLVLMPAKGREPNEVERKSASVVLLNGITGQPSVYQPL